MPSTQKAEIEKKIKQLATAYEKEIITIRNYLHENPELSFQEHNTADFVLTKLQEFGITNVKRVIETGVIAEIEGAKKGKTIALRADMDALPIEEDKNNPVCSKVKGVMHACGHDMHTASLLGTAKILQEIKEELSGKIVLIFQPGEEYMPSGAKMLMESGELDAYDIEWIVGQHTAPEVEAGKIGFKSGAYMASTDEIFLMVKGKGGHGAFPHLLNDTVLAASQVVVALQQLASRRKNPVLPPTVLSIGKFVANGATNIIPSEVELAGTLRCMDENWRKEAKELIKEIAENTAKAFGCTCDVNINHGYPAVTNTVDLTKQAQKAAANFLGTDNVEELPLRMGGEDFGFYTLKYPSTFYRFGVKSPNQKHSQNLHTPNFFGDEKALKTAMSTMAWVAFCHLNDCE